MGAASAFLAPPLVNTDVVGHGQRPASLRRGSFFFLVPVSNTDLVGHDSVPCRSSE